LSEAIKQRKDETGESTIQDAEATVVDAPQSQMDTNSNDLEIRRSPDVVPADDDCVFVARSSPSLASPPTSVIEQTISLRLTKEIPTDPNDLKLEKLEKKEYVDLEDLAKMTKYKQIVEEKNSGLESQQSTQPAVNDVAFCRISSRLLPQDVNGANIASAASAASSSVVLIMPSNSLPMTKPSRPGNEKKERDESWQNYIKRYRCSSIV